MKKVLIAGLLGGLASFAWGAFSHVALPWHLATMTSLRDDTAVLAALRNDADGPGIYLIPGAPDHRGDHSPEAREAWMKAVDAGPFAYLVYAPGGGQKSNPRPYVVGLLVEIAVAALCAGLLALAAGSLPRYAHRVTFVACLGALAAMRGPVTQWNWMFHPAASTLVECADVFMGFLVTGLVIAAVIKTPRAAAA